MISSRAAALVAHPPTIAAAHLRAEADPYHPRHNPRGYLNLGIAENRLVWDLLAPRLNDAREICPEDVRYGPLHGTAALRDASADLLTGWWRTRVDPDHLVVVSGATAALDIIVSVLCDPGDAVVLAAPYYSALEVVLTARSGARLVPAPLSSSDGFRLDAAELERAILRAGNTVRAIVLTSPCNPTGHVHSAATLREVLAVARRHDLDVIADEIYANSAFGADEFVSVLDPRVRGDNPVRVHAIWGFAKDFGLSGLKVGVLHTENTTALAAARALAYFAPVSTATQAMLTDLLDDRGWVREFLAASRKRLAESYHHTASLLDAHGIPYLPASAGFSVWLDLRRWLPARGAPGERWLARDLLDRAHVNITPGTAFGCPEPGWFRLCHTSSPELVEEGVRRIAEHTRGSAVAG
jgi:1-aminocyclopropane-1-carboxylate synthase 1/2/6